MSPLLLLIIALGALLVGPMLARAWSRGRAWRAFIDGLSLALVGGICFLMLAPHALEQAGLWAVAAGAVGLALPVISHRLSTRWERTFAYSGLGLLAIHAAVDGSALALGEEAGTLGLAVVAHRLPMGLAVYSAAVRSSESGEKAGWLSVLTLMAGTIVGFLLGAPVSEGSSPFGQGLFEAFVAGLLLHIVFEHAPVFPAPGEAQLGRGAHDHAAHDHAAHEHKAHDHAAHEHKAHDHDHAAHEHKAHDHGHKAHDHGHKAHDHGHKAHDHGHAAATHAPAPPPREPRHGAHQHSHGHAHASAREVAAAGGTRWSAAGALTGLIVVTGLIEATAHDNHAEPAVFDALLDLTFESAPPLLLGYVLAGLLVAFLPTSGVGMGANRSALGQALTGMAVGLPMPVCSCGVLPLYETFVRRGAPVVAALSFLVATPELGVDAVLLSVPLLGLPLTVARVVTAALVAIVVALLVGRAVPAHTCSTENTTAPPPEPLAVRIRRGLAWGLGDLVDHTLPWVVLGLVVAALAGPVLTEGWLPTLPGPVQVIVCALIGIPVYVCATGATPLAAVMVASGVTPGAALALLISGPATNVTTFGVLSTLHGRKVAFQFGVAVVGLATFAGLVVDALDIGHPTAADVAAAAPAHTPLAMVPVVLLLGVLVLSLFRQGARGVVAQIVEPVELRRI